MDNSVPKAFIFMKVVNYGEDTLEEIMERKQRELNDVGWTYWGYGGNEGTGPLHPKKQVQPFAGQWMKEPGSVQVLMEKIDGKFNIELPTAKKYSADDSVDEERWNCLPSGIYLPRTKWALVLGEIIEVTPPLELDLRDYKVGIGPSCGNNAAKYLSGKTSKGCLVETETPYRGSDAPETVTITYQAFLKFPYAVFLK